MTRSLTGPETAWSRFTLWRQQVLLGAAYRARGDLRASEQTWRNAFPAGGTLPNYLVIASLDELYEEQGRLRELGRLYEDVFRSCREQHHLTVPAARHGALALWSAVVRVESPARSGVCCAATPSNWSHTWSVLVPAPELRCSGSESWRVWRWRKATASGPGSSWKAKSLTWRGFPFPRRAKDVLILIPVRLALALRPARAGLALGLDLRVAL